MNINDKHCESRIHYGDKKICHQKIQLLLTWCDQQNLTHLPALIQPLTEQDELTALTQLDKKLRPPGPGSKCAAAFSIFEVQ